MTNYRKASENLYQVLNNALPEQADDSKNPAFIFQGIDSSLLAAAVRGEIDLNKLAMKELADRGLNERAEWVGFDAAKALFSKKQNA